MRLLIAFVVTRTIVIDVGKSFLHSAVEWFPKHGLRRIDAVLITHAHADGRSSVPYIVSCAHRSTSPDAENILQR